MGIDEKDIMRKVKEFFENNFLSLEGDMIIDDDLSFFENGVIDSTGVLELIDFLEENFSIVIEDEEVVPDNLDSFNKIVSFVLRKKGLTGG